MLNNDESVVLQKLSLNVHTLHFEKNPLLFFLSVESSSGSMEGSSGKLGHTNLILCFSDFPGLFLAKSKKK